MFLKKRAPWQHFKICFKSEKGSLIPLLNGLLCVFVQLCKGSVYTCEGWGQENVFNEKRDEQGRCVGVLYWLTSELCLVTTAAQKAVYHFDRRWITRWKLLLSRQWIKNSDRKVSLANNYSPGKIYPKKFELSRGCVRIWRILMAPSILEDLLQYWLACTVKSSCSANSKTMLVDVPKTLIYLQ